MLNKDTLSLIDELAGSLEFEEYEEIKFIARDIAGKVDRNKSKDNLLWVMCLRLSAQILVDAGKHHTSVHKYLSKDKYLT